MPFRKPGYKAYIHLNTSMSIAEQFVLIASKDLNDFAAQVTIRINEGGTLAGNHVVTAIPARDNEFLYSQSIVYHQRHVKDEFGKKPLTDLPEYLR